MNTIPHSYQLRTLKKKYLFVSNKQETFSECQTTQDAEIVNQ